MIDTTTILIMVNIAATLLGFFRVALVVERRLTKIETIIEQHDRIISKISLSPQELKS